MEKKRIVVTGGAGLIGSRLCERLLGEGHRVTCLDSLLNGGRETVEALQRHPQFRFIHHNVINPFNIDADQIYNLAAPSNPSFFRNFPVETLKINLLGVINALESARGNGATLLHASAGDVYGSSRMLVQGESYWGNVNPTGVRSANEEGKRATESLCEAYGRQLRVPVRIARIFNTYGPGASPHDSRVLFHFITDALRGDDLTIFGNGQQTRCFCYVDDMVDGLVRLMNSQDNTAGIPVNLGSNIEITVGELARRIIEITGSRSRIVHLNPQEDDPRHKTPDISRARQLLDWEPVTSLDEGLSKTVEYMEKQFSEDDSRHPYLSWVERS